MDNTSRAVTNRIEKQLQFEFMNKQECNELTYEERAIVSEYIRAVEENIKKMTEIANSIKKLIQE